MDNRDKKHLEENKKYTLLINYPVLWAGGIETYLASLMRYYLKEGHRVIWLTTSQYRENIAFDGLLDTPGLEIAIWEKWSRLFAAPKIHFEKNEQVIMITCRAAHYAAGELLRRKAGLRDFKHIYTVAHHSGSAYYPDRRMKSAWGKRVAYGYWKRTLEMLVKKDWLFCFAEIQLENYESHYHVSIPNKTGKLVPFVDSEQLHFDEENAGIREQERKDRFVITTCARFEFPHKGYILGLVDSYCRLKKEYPHIILQIIGDGSDGVMLREKIAALPDEIRKDIIMTGMVPPDNLNDYYKKSHVIVGLAGAILSGAQAGIPSVVVRHDCNICETYGFIEDAFDKTLCDIEGEEITPLLERCINMDREEYLRHSQAGFDRVQQEFADASKCMVDCYFRQQNENVFAEQNWYDRLIGRILYVITELKNRFER